MNKINIGIAIKSIPLTEDLEFVEQLYDICSKNDAIQDVRDVLAHRLRLEIRQHVLGDRFRFNCVVQSKKHLVVLRGEIPVLNTQQKTG